MTTFYIIVGMLTFLYYAVNIIKDAFFTKEKAEDGPRLDEEEVDISSEAGSFQPVEIRKDAPSTPRENTGKGAENGMGSPESTDDKEPAKAPLEDENDNTLEEDGKPEDQTQLTDGEEVDIAYPRIQELATIGEEAELASLINDYQILDSSQR